MPQKTNLNISPYYDDFDKDDNFYKVLFKPGQPVQARELTTLQSILQNQVEAVGSHLFKDGSMVIPGSINYDSNYYSLKINTEHLGVPVSLYADQLIGKRLKGQTSGIVVRVDKYALPAEGTNITDLTLFVQYLDSGNDNAVRSLDDGEVLITEESFVYGNTPINVNDTVATLVSFDAANTGCAVSIGAGVYYIRGTFVDVEYEKIVLDPYTNSPSYRVGLTVLEELISAKDEPSLYDNARGFSNYAAPGADRLKISALLSKKALTDFEDKSFIELVKIRDGEILKLQNKTIYSELGKEFARRTFAESGNYAVDKFTVQVEDSLNDRIGNEGVFDSDEVTDQGNTPTDDLMCVKVSPGKAFVKGWEVDKGGTTVLDIEKPRDKEVVESALVPFQMGNLLRVNNVRGTPLINTASNTNIVTFYDQRVDASDLTDGAGTGVGQARVYSLQLTDAAYTDSGTEWDLYLFDVQFWTNLQINSAITLPDTSHIRGVSSGATGYLVGAISNNANFDVTQVSGEFIAGEQIIINDNPTISRTVVAVKTHGVHSIKSVHQDTTSIGGTVDFIADTVLSRIIPTGFNVTDQITINSSGVATCGGKNFLGIRSDSILRYQLSGFGTETYNRVRWVSADGKTMNVSAVDHVPSVCSGSLPASDSQVSFSVGIANITNEDNAGLYTKLNTPNVSDIDLSGSTLLVTKQITGETTTGTGELTINVSQTGIASGFYEAYDSDRYSIHYNAGTVETLSSDQFTLDPTGSSITFGGCLPSQSGNVTVNTTVRKADIKSKKKDFIRSQKKIISEAVVGINTTLTGLTTSFYYGLRIQDKEVSLHVPDVANIVGVYESIDTLDPVLDKLVFIQGLQLRSTAIVGERVVGGTTGAVAQITDRPSDTQIEISYLTQNKFAIGELVTFEESNIKTSLQDITVGKYLNITTKFNLDTGHREQYCDFSRIVRKSNVPAPGRRVLVVYDCYTVPANDNGDAFTIDSYAQERFGSDIPILKNDMRATDTLDFRPRVAEFTSTTTSPFAPASRDFSSSTNPSLVVAPNESSILGYSYYLPRIDKLVLDRYNFSLIKGVSSFTPREPELIENSMHVATIVLPAYLYDSDDATVTLVDNRRYTMRDIGKIEDRVENLEVLTSLSLLELDTKTLQVQDADGLSRFKSGFFVDDFKDTNLLDIGNIDCKVDVDSKNKELNVPLDFYSIQPELALLSTINSDTADYSTDLELLDSNVRKTGDLITLDYQETGWIEQPLASRVENVNPFNMVEYSGNIALNPASDTWVRNIYVDGGQRTVTGERGGFSGEYIETIKTSSQPDEHIRSRNIAFSASGFKPVTRQYPFFDSTSGIDIIPKLIEIDMGSGIFQVGETVDGFDGSNRLIRFRIAAPNHKKGPVGEATIQTGDAFNANPYDTSSSLGSAYSASSTVLNVDINALSQEVEGRFFGYIKTDLTLIGQTSGAQAKVANVRLVADTYGDLYGSFFIRDPLSSPPPPLRFRTGTKTFRLTSSSSNATPLPGSLLISSGETTYRTSGIVDIYRQTTVRVLPPPPPPPRRDPLAQTFTTDVGEGCFLTSVDLFFANKDTTQKLFVQLRTVELGTPTGQLVQDFAHVAVDPSDINVSTNAEVATRVTFPSPIYLEGDTEYALVVLAPTTDLYEAWIARMGEKTVNTQSLPDAESVMVTRQYLGGSLFKSQNGTIWTPSQFEDLKFKLYKSQFTQNSGTVYFYNPKLGDQTSQVPSLVPNAVRTLPRKLRVPIDKTTVMGNVLVPGVQVTSVTTSAPTTPADPSGYIERVGGEINTITVSNVGAGYSGGTFSSVNTYAITGQGKNAQVSVVFNANGTINGVPSVSAAGVGYAPGDVIGITTSSVSRGSDATLTVGTIDGIDTLYLTNVQGEAFTNNQPLAHYDGQSNGSPTISQPGLIGTAINGSSEVIGPLCSGNILEVTQYNHGMHSDTNKVVINDVEPNTPPVLLTQNISNTDTGTISVASTSEFATFNGISTAFGYAKVNNEIIYYNSIGNGTLGIATRGIDGSLQRSHSINDIIYKYELNGISLTGINTIHNFTAGLGTYRDFDTYHLEIDRMGRNTGLTQLSFTDELSVGGENIFASQNFQYDAIIPQFNILTPTDSTTVQAQLRSVTGTSAGGNETSFIDQGYQDVSINQLNKLNSTRIVCSEVNEVARLSNLPKSRSTTLAIQLNSTNSNLSPVLDTQNGSLILQRSRLNNPVTDYSNDSRVNQVSGDPHSAVYISNRIDLKQPATSLKVLISAYRHASADFRVLYQLFRADTSEAPAYQLFPGYNNLTDTDGDGFGDTVIDVTLNDGRADSFVPSSAENEFLEYQFSSDDLTQFTGFAVKIVCSGSDEAHAPKFKDLRIIALA